MTIRILGIDPGSRTTGFGVIDCRGNELVYVDSGCIRTGAGEFPQRLAEIYAGIGELLVLHGPSEISVERVFMHRNADSALKLGAARAAAMCAVFALDGSPLAIAEYSAREVKRAVAGYGAAEKSQVSHMVCRLLSLDGAPQADAADALAVALCHAYARRTSALLARAAGADR